MPEGRHWLTMKEAFLHLTKEEKMKVFDDYNRAIETSDEDLLKKVFAPQVRLDVPAGATLNEPRDTAAHIMGQVGKVIARLKNALTADAGNDWYLLTFEGQLDGESLQSVDQVHLDKQGQIDHLTLYMRPIAAAQKFSELIGKRLQPASAR